MVSKQCSNVRQLLVRLYWWACARAPHKQRKHTHNHAVQIKQTKSRTETHIDLLFWSRRRQYIYKCVCIVSIPSTSSHNTVKYTRTHMLWEIQRTVTNSLILICNENNNNMKYQQHDGAKQKRCKNNEIYQLSPSWTHIRLTLVLHFIRCICTQTIECSNLLGARTVVHCRTRRWFRYKQYGLDMHLHLIDSVCPIDLKFSSD